MQPCNDVKVSAYDLLRASYFTIGQAFLKEFQKTVTHIFEVVRGTWCI